MKKLNMKVVGTTLAPTKMDEGVEESKKDEPREDGRVWADVNMDGLTREQKKKLRKKLAHKRRKAKAKEDGVADESKIEEETKIEES